LERDPRCLDCRERASKTSTCPTVFGFLCARGWVMTGATSCGDRVLVAYAATAILPDGTIDVAILHEPQAGHEGPRALAKFIGFRALYASLGAVVSFTTIWVTRSDAIAQGFLS
jgi:hypothetical protein